jgi:hypothetical protein
VGGARRSVAEAPARAHTHRRRGGLGQMQPLTTAELRDLAQALPADRSTAMGSQLKKANRRRRRDEPEPGAW